MKVKVIYSRNFENEKRYIVHTVFCHFLKIECATVEFSEDINSNEVHILCEDNPESKMIVLNNVLLNVDENAWLAEESLPVAPIKYINLDGLSGKFLYNNVPVIYGNSLGKVCYEKDNALHCDLDLFGGMFFYLTLYEEVVINKFDEHGRFNYLDSIIYKSELYLRPVVNEYLEILKVLFTISGNPIVNEKRSYQLILSHDVDRPFSHDANAYHFIRNIFADLILRKSFITFFQKALSRILPIRSYKYRLDPYNNFHYLMSVSERYNIKSYFNFIAVNGRGNIDGYYEISDEYFRKLLKEINDRGHVIGLHPSYETYNNYSLLLNQYKKLKNILDNLSIPSESLGGRQHFLRWRNPITWQLWEDIGLKYDSSLGSANYLGFRCGTCYEFPVFNLYTRKALQLIEYPLLVMDVCAFNLEPKESMNSRIIDIGNICRYYNGNMTFLFHNNYVVTNRQKSSYENLISKLI